MADDELNITAFERLAAEADRARDGTAVARFAAALALWWASRWRVIAGAGSWRCC